MKALNFEELSEIVASLASYHGFRLEDMVHDEKNLGLRLFEARRGRGIWLWMDWKIPLLIPLEKGLQIKGRRTSPLRLFFMAHFKGSLFQGARCESKWGRVVWLSFLGSDGELSEIEVRLIPRGVNFQLRWSEKQVSLFKPKGLAPSTAEPSGVRRGMDEIKKEFEDLQIPKASTQKEKSLVEDLKKIDRSIRKVEEELESKKTSPWRKLGHWLVENQRLEVPEEWLDFVNPDRALSWNVEHCFSMAKRNEAKIQSVEKRLKDLGVQRELVLKGGLKEPHKKEPHFLSLAQVRGRSLALDGGIKVHLGRSGKDNIDLLRKASPWDLWIHLRDYPGAHAIIRRNKGQRVSDGELRRASLWLIQETKKSFSSGDRVDVVVAEVRHVKPIKGDRLGRVTFQSERTLRVQIP